MDSENTKNKKVNEELQKPVSLKNLDFNSQEDLDKVLTQKNSYNSKSVSNLSIKSGQYDGIYREDLGRSQLKSVENNQTILRNNSAEISNDFQLKQKVKIELDDNFYDSDLEEYNVSNEELKFGYLGIYEKSNLAQRLAQSEKELHDQRAFIVSTFANSLKLRDDDVFPDLFAEEEDANDPALKLEKETTTDKMKLKYKDIKVKSKNRFHKAMLKVPKTKYQQQKYLEKRILSIDDDRASQTGSQLINSEKLKDNFIFEKSYDSKSNSEESNWNPPTPVSKFGVGTGKTRYRIKNMFKY